MSSLKCSFILCCLLLIIFLLMIQALSHEVNELKSQKMKIESQLVTSGDVGELAREKTVNSC